MRQELEQRQTPADNADVDRDVTIRLRASKAEAKAWKDAADRAGLSLSEYIRRRITGETTIEVPPPPAVKKRGR